MKKRFIFLCCVNAALITAFGSLSAVCADAEQEFTIDTWLKVYVNIETPLPDETIEYRKIQGDPSFIPMQQMKT